MVYLDKAKDPAAFDIKMNLIDEQKSPYKKFRVVDNLEEKIMYDFISWIRYVEFDEDMAQLYLFKNEAIIEAQKKKKQYQESDSDDNQDVKDVFKGTSLKVINTKNELKVWNKIIFLVDVHLSKYDTNLETDEGLLEMDDKEHNLHSNERNCLLYRIGEKKILHFLKDAATNIIPLITMNYKDARKQVSKY